MAETEGGNRRISHGRLGSKIRRSKRTAIRHTKAIEAAGICRINRTRKRRDYSNANEYVFLDVNGSDLTLNNDKNVTQVLKTDLQLTTPAALPRPQVDFCNRNPRFQRLIEYKNLLEAQNRSLRSIVRGKNHKNPPDPWGGSGVHAPVTPDTPEDVEARAKFWRKYREQMAKLDAEGADRRAAIAEILDRQRREREEKPTPPDPEMQARIDRLNRRLRS
jgi:hypothetical protein